MKKLQFHPRLSGNYYYLSLLLLIFIPDAPAHAQTMEDHWWIPYGDVRAIAKDDATNTVYLGGSFSHVGPPISFGATLDPGTGLPVSNLHPDGIVNSAIPDAAGGWFIGGNFSSIGGQPRSGLARINSDGSLHPWNPQAVAYINSIALIGNNLYVGTDSGAYKIDETSGNL